LAPGVFCCSDRPAIHTFIGRQSFLTRKEFSLGLRRTAWAKLTQEPSKEKVSRINFQETFSL
jgi:hypothetical protein